MERLVQLTPLEVDSISTATVNGGFRFLNKNDALQPGQSTYSTFFKRKLNALVPTGKYGVDNFKESGSFNMKIYMHCVHNGNKAFKGKSTLTFKVADLKANQPLNLVWDIECNLCQESFPSAGRAVQQNVSEVYYSGMGDKIIGLLNECKIQHKHLSLDEIVKHTPKLMAEVSRTLANYNEEYAAAHSRRPNHTGHIEIQNPPVPFVPYVPQQRSTQVREVLPTPPPSRSPSRSPMRIPTQSLNVAQVREVIPPLTPSRSPSRRPIQSKSPSPTPVRKAKGRRSFNVIYSSSEEESDVDNFSTPLAASTSYENSSVKVPKQKKVKYAVSSQAKLALKK
jgi:hypothetical protein